MTRAGAQQLGVSRDALATTIGPLLPDPVARSLQTEDRARIAAWLEERWRRIERRAGCLVDRDPARWYGILAFERWREDQHSGLPPFALDLFYRVRRAIPRPAQLGLRRMLIRLQRTPPFPAWPFEDAGVDLVRIAFADALVHRGVSSVRFPWFWPDGSAAAVTLTHDVESADGLARAAEVASWEERHGFRSSFNVVRDSYRVNDAQLEHLRSRGHEIGSHGIHHDRSLFASRRSFEEQLPLLRKAASDLGAVGFRSPATYRVVEWLRELPFSYDCTMSHSDPYEPMPGGTATVWPFFHGDVVELPYTAPQDHTLFNLLGYQDASLWCAQFQCVVARNGLFQPLTHPDREYLGRPLIGHAYRDLLAAIAERTDVWVALPRDIAEWWSRRVQGLTPRADGIGRWTGSEISLSNDAAGNSAHQRGRPQDPPAEARAGI